MYTITISEDLWKTIFTFLGTLSWPIIVLVIICLFRNPITYLIARIKSAKWKDVSLEFGDMVRAYSPDKRKISYGIVQPVPALKVRDFLSELPLFNAMSTEKVDPSYYRALNRIEEDTDRVGYQRGKPYKLPNGKWGVAWDMQISEKIIIK